MNLNDLSKQVHAANIKWWQNPETGEPIKRNEDELLALAVSEISECLEGLRKDLMDDKLPHRKMAEVELADAKIRLLDFAAGFGIEIRERTWFESIPDNRAAALLGITKAICCISGAASLKPYFLSASISHIEACAAKWGYDLDGAMREKTAFNATRIDHTHEARRIAGGKQF